MKTQTLDMRFIRYLNLFAKITGVRSKSCFFHNNWIVFAVPGPFISKSIGEKGKNVKKLSSIIGSKIKIVAVPNDLSDAEKFISDIIAPNTFKSLEVTPDEIIITASRQSKATLIGRNKVRLLELEKIVKESFGKSLRIA